MFTGIVESVGHVVSVGPADGAARLVVDRGAWEPRGYVLAIGDSVCVSGVCLTVVEMEQSRLGFDVVAETLSRTTLGALQTGAIVNLEGAVTAGTPLGGHWMQGHVDGIGRVKRILGREAGGDRRLVIETLPARGGADEVLPYIVPKGSVAVEGVSLTIAAVVHGGFEIALIPTTLERTTLGQIDEGCRVNLEADILSKTVVWWLRHRGGAGAMP